ncbi:MAG: glycosyltransferase [Actinomycetaceae bacterium]|nr:glycosyltransferase [Actinomycetaceae bacterium]MDY6082706.1 glycosyltransferase [Actinomycetaceae bacterium]
MKDLRTDLLANSILRQQTARDQELEWISTLQSQSYLKAGRTKSLVEGISIILPVWHARATIERLLLSLIEQSLDQSLFEIVVVCNGEDDGSVSILERYRNALPLRVYHLDYANAGLARNYGISLAKREYMTFVDADDALEAHFLESLWSHASRDTVVVAPIVNIDQNGERREDNDLNRQILAHAGQTVSPQSVPWVFGFNACKLFATRLANEFSYNSDLKSGEDLVFFAHLFAVSHLKVVFPQGGVADCSYLRYMTSDSVSRQTESFDFNVRQRLQCIRELEEIGSSLSDRSGIDALISGQLGFIRRYVGEDGDRLDRVAECVAEANLDTLVWQRFNRGRARDLVISYCFPPDSDTSGTIAAKAVAERRRVVDVISNDMSSVRGQDPSVVGLCAPWIDSVVQVASRPSFNNWALICDFAVKARAIADRQAAAKNGYATLYTRALWVGSHVAGALYKIDHPTVQWTAEFSDPLRFEVDGAKRAGALTNNQIQKQFESIIAGYHFDDVPVQTLFDLTELITFILADELIFTNDNQLSYMLMDYPEKVQTFVRNKAVVRPHPTPSPRFYHYEDAHYYLRSEFVNIGYFGNFYKNRGLGSVFQSIARLSEHERAQLKLHIFTNSVDAVHTAVDQYHLQDCVIVNEYLPYFQFLNLCSKLDVVMLNDVEAGSGLPLNPFLPSKLSDYKGSGTKIWGITDSGSPLSREPIAYRSRISEPQSVLGALRKILLDCQRSHEG